MKVITVKRRFVSDVINKQNAHGTSIVSYNKRIVSLQSFFKYASVNHTSEKQPPYQLLWYESVPDQQYPKFAV